MSKLVVVDRYLPHHGGSRYYYHELACRLVGAVVLTGRQPGDREFDATCPVPVVRRPGIRPDYASRFRNLGNPWLYLALAYLPGVLAMVFWLSWQLLRQRPRTVHAGGYAFAGLAARLVCPLLGIPWVVYAHGEDVSSTLRRPMFRRLMAWVYRGAGHLIVNCENTGRLVQQCGVDARSIVVANPGIDPGWLADADPRDLPAEIPPAGPVMLTVGRLVPHKGHRTLVDALPAIRQAVPDVRWVLVGDGPEGERLHQRLDELGLSGAVNHYLRLPLERLRALQMRADLFVQPNGNVDGAHEGYGMVFLEAGASRTAVIGGRDGGVPEVIDHGVTGLLVPPFDPDALAAAVVALLADDDRRSGMAQAGHDRARKATWDHTLAPILALDQRSRPLSAARQAS